MCVSTWLQNYGAISAGSSDDAKGASCTEMQLGISAPPPEASRKSREISSAEVQHSEDAQKSQMQYSSRMDLELWGRLEFPAQQGPDDTLEGMEEDTMRYAKRGDFADWHSHMGWGGRWRASAMTGWPIATIAT